MTAAPARARIEDLPAQDNTAIVSRSDAIESVRIVRTEPVNGVTAEVEAPQVVPVPVAQVMTEEAALQEESTSEAAAEAAARQRCTGPVRSSS